MRPGGRPLIATLLVLLTILHWDFWLWDDPGIWLGFLPAGLCYHVAFSLAAALVWLLALRVAWPAEVEAWADGVDEESPS